MTVLQKHSAFVFSPTAQWRNYLSQILWNIHSPTEIFLKQTPPSNAQTLWYESTDDQLSSIFFFPKLNSLKKSPVILLSGPFFHPKITCTQHTPAIQELRTLGHDVYIISHRGHQKDVQREREHSFDSIAREDIPAALRAIRNHSGSHQYHWIGQGLGGILCLIWIAQSGWSSIESLSLFNTPVQFSSVPTPLLYHLLKPMEKNSAHRFFQLILACSKDWDLSPQERFWMYQSIGQLKISLIRQVLLWCKTGQICSVDGRIHYRNALKTTDIPISIYSTNAKCYGGHLSSYPALNIFPKARWIESNSAVKFPLFSTKLPRQYHLCA